ncbi:MAG: nickel pincer cofactor biosynthesis protein LarB [Candidatus Latescibacterota bacterium]|nr:MAG: nickel pincer cofactor biosynthesis protein LarB [Candidatus Latescibacterota bacterium]
MHEDALRKLLDEFKKGEKSEYEVLDALRHLPFEDIGFAKVDHHRTLRKGFPEVVYGAGKTDEQILAIAEKITGKGHNFLVTRIGESVGTKLKELYPDGEYHEAARIFALEIKPVEKRGYVLVLTAGTSDIPVAEEAAITASLLGCNVDRIFDVGVAGVHRLLAYQSMIEAADVVIVAAGMEGALASVVASLTQAPTVALPTSIGYGASFEGLSALLGMLNSCASGVSVVNIDNGFGAGCVAALICARGHKIAKELRDKT